MRNIAQITNRVKKTLENPVLSSKFKSVLKAFPSFDLTAFDQGLVAVTLKDGKETESLITLLNHSLPGKISVLFETETTVIRLIEFDEGAGAEACLLFLCDLAEHSGVVSLDANLAEIKLIDGNEEKNSEANQ